jgi:hypothetical protein
MVITSSIFRSFYKIATGLLLLVAFTLIFVQSVFAQAYGEGIYGGSGNNTVYGGSTDAGNDDDDDDDKKDSKKCTDKRPGDNPPQITKAVVNKAAKTIELTFTSGAGPREGFEIRYTTNPEDFSGVDHYDVDRDRNSYDRTINISNTSANHYIKVRAVNGCAEGPYSKTETVDLGSSLKAGTTTYSYSETPTQVEQGSGAGGIGGLPDQANAEPKEQVSQEGITGSSGSAGATNDSNAESVPGPTDENVSEDSSDQGFNWNPLENMLLLGIIGAILFTSFGVMIVRRFFL